jgi:hypothetical protein
MYIVVYRQKLSVHFIISCYATPGSGRIKNTVIARRTYLSTEKRYKYDAICAGDSCLKQHVDNRPDRVKRGNKFTNRKKRFFLADIKNERIFAASKKWNCDERILFYILLFLLLL